MELNEAQQQAVLHDQGPMLVLAGPGSGKTRVITERVRHLIQVSHVNPSDILVITFTKAAALEMRERFRKTMSSETAPVTFGTFHAVFFMMLRRAYHYTADNIIRDDVRRQILKSLIDRTKLEVQDENDFINEVASEISLVKGEQIDLNNYFSGSCPSEVFNRIYKGYQEALIRRRLLDFDDILVDCYELLKQRKDIRKIWQDRYPYILIDEFQDINKIQYEIVKMLAAPRNNLFVVGDDDQSIYGFRGAKPDIMQYFLKDFEGVKQCNLSVNYRCSGAIVWAAGLVVSENQTRLPKKITAFREKGAPVEIRQFDKVIEENEAIRKKILMYRNQEIPYHEMAILFRTNVQARAMTSKLMEFNIPFIMKERIPNIYDHWIAKDILAYVHAALGNRERGTFLRIINRPNRYVHRNAFTESYVDLEELKLFYEDKSWMVDRLEQLQYDLQMISKMRPYAAVNYIRRGVMYDDYIREYADYRGIRSEDMFEILNELQEDARDWADFEQWFEHIVAYGQELEDQMKKRSSGQENGQKEDAVNILTMHGAKGLEYKCVFIPDVNEGVIPHNKAVLTADLEEERRMFYVAMTRAKDHLHMYYVKERFNKEADVSRFLQKLLPKDAENGKS